MGYMYFASRIIFFIQFLVPLVWFEFHIGPTVSVGNVAVSVTCCFPWYGC